MDEKKVIQKLLEHDRRFDRLEDKMQEFRNEILTGLDKVMVIVQRLDQERIFTVEAIRRIQDQQDKQQVEINEMKHVLKIS